MLYNTRYGRLYFRTQRRDQYARARGFDNWTEYQESRLRAQQLRDYSPASPITPPWVVLGWSRKKYRKWLRNLEHTLPTKTV